jgi:hypothetical protein
MKLQELSIHSYRGQIETKLEALGQVNMITGPRGDGKSSVMEAIHILSNPWYVPHLLEAVRVRGYYHKTDSSFNDFNLFLSMFQREEGEDQLGYHSVQRALKMSGILDGKQFIFGIGGLEIYDWPEDMSNEEIDLSRSNHHLTGSIIVNKNFQEQVNEYYHRYHNRAFTGKMHFQISGYENEIKNRVENRLWSTELELKSYEKYTDDYDPKKKREQYRAIFKNDSTGKLDKEPVNFDPTIPLFKSEYVCFNDSITESVAFTHDITSEEREEIIKFIQLLEPEIEDIAFSMSPTGFSFNGLVFGSPMRVLPFVKHKRFNSVPLYMFGDILFQLTRP